MSEEKKKVELSNIVSTAIQIPGVKVNREAFLREQFKEFDKELIEQIVDNGTVLAGCTRDVLKKKATRIIKERTAMSTGASFVAGIPGGLAMAATVPADMLQFYGVALRMAQELVYLYGEEDLWCGGTLDSEKVTNQLILYCGVMLGATGAAQSVRVMTSALAKQLMKKLPQKALTKTFYYPIVKAIMRFFGVSVTKTTFAKGVSKVVPVVGGVVSGGITLASMLPMGNRLAKTLDKAHFDYSEEDFEADISVIKEVADDEKEESKQDVKIIEEVKREDIFEKIEKAKIMLDNGVITEEEFAAIKTRLISEL